MKNKWKEFVMGYHFRELPKNWAKAYDKLMNSKNPEKLCDKWVLWQPYENYSADDLVGAISAMAELAQHTEGCP